jgi:hypothetical protein
MHNRRLENDPDVSFAPESSGGFRLRYLLFLAGLATAVWQLSPRAQAAWTLRERATQFANYALCMVGPTGPSLLRDQPAEFWELVRRRVVGSEPSTAPFVKCAPLVVGLSESPPTEAAHLATAEQFIEYGGTATDQVRQARTPVPLEGVVSIDELEVTTRSLALLAAEAWPFERSGYTRLVRPSSHAAEAPHPVEFPKPGMGTGLPTWRALYRPTWQVGGRWLLAQGHQANLALFESVDQGLNWRQVGLVQPGLAENAGRCGATGSRNTFTFELGERGLIVHSWLGDQIQHTTAIETSGGVGSASCDEETALLALREEGKPPSVLLCRHAGHCGQLPVDAEWLRNSFDVARIAGVSVIAAIDHGVVRVRSSRDNGLHWAPATVAFDWQGLTKNGGDLPVPSQFLKVGNRLLLHGEAKSGSAYPVMVSDDHGASWRGMTSPTVKPTTKDVVSQR